MAPAGRRWRVAAGSLLALAAACARPPAVEEPSPPPGLEALEAPIQSQYRELRAAFDAARQRPATNAEIAQAAGELGRWYHVYHFHAGADVAYAGAQALAPDDPRWPYYRAHLARGQGDLEAAAVLFSRVLELTPNRLAAQVWLAEIQWQAGEAAAAEAGFAAALARDPGCVRALAGQAKAAAARGDAAAAAELYRAALELQPQASELRYALGLAYRELGDLELAAAPEARVRDGARALDLAASAAGGGDATLTAAETLAMAFAELGRWNEARDWQRAAVAAAGHSGRGKPAALARRRLELYSGGRPCREPWARGEAVSQSPVAPPGAGGEAGPASPSIGPSEASRSR